MKINKTVKVGLLSSLISIVATGGIAVAAVNISAKDIGFNSGSENWEATNVEDAMNDLYVLGNDKLPENYNKGYNDGYNKGIEGGAKVYKLGNGRSFNISSIVGTENVGKYTSNNFIAVPISGVSLTVNATYELSDKTPSAVTNVSSGAVAYDASTGIVTVSGFSASSTICKYSNGSGAMDSRGADLTVTVYFIDGVIK